ncbi:MAG: Na/Pi cotransporter family protein [Lachnospiraceae bacterium]|nr:Na/Pi cotransporter family protein [Lachnospiraceae bacterium]
MDIFTIITLLGGLAFFLYGMNVLSSGLERMAGGKLETILKKMTSNPFKSLLLGMGITAAIQSSSAMTVMLVGLVNSGIMSLNQTVGVIMGSNIGTTVTAWILSLVGIEGDNLFMNLLKPKNFSLLFAFIGILMIMISKKPKKKDVGAILVGFAILMFGMETMSGAVKPLAEEPGFQSILTAFKNPILGVAFGAIFTAIIQSSSASVGILQALAAHGGITFGMAIPIIMGQNIGTCITSVISSIGVSRNAKKVSIVHITFNLIGTAICLSAFCISNAIFDLVFVDTAISPFWIAIVHSIFNIVTTLLLLPFSKKLVKIANLVLKDKDGDTDTKQKTELLDERLLVTPSIAIAECENATNKLANLAKDALVLAIDTSKNYNEDNVNEVIKLEDTTDKYEDKLGTYLVKISSKTLSDADSKKVSKMLHAIGDFERLGDHAVNIVKVAQELHEKKLKFSDQAQHELSVLTGALTEILDLTTEAYNNNDVDTAKRVEPLEQVIDQLVAAIKAQHIQRLQAGSCSIEMGFILSDLLNNYSRVSDHCSNVAVAIIEIAHNTFDTHQYLNNVKYSSSSFNDIYENFSAKYYL